MDRGPLDIQVRQDGVAAQVLLHGDLDLATADELVGTVEVLLADGWRTLVVDLSDVGLCDSSGLSALIRVHQATREARGALTLTGLGPQLSRIMHITGLGGVLPIPG